MDVSKSICDEEHNFFEMKEKCKVSCVKLVVWSIVPLKLFYIFEYCDEYGVECSAESGAK